MKRWHIFFSLVLTLAVLAGCAVLDEKQRGWIFQPSERNWGDSAELAPEMQDVWISFNSAATGQPTKLHGLWLPADASRPGWNGRPGSQTPLLLYLHGARWNVTGSVPRVRRMQQLGFSVLIIDYRGFGKSTPELLPSETMAYEDTRAAWDWLAARHPGQPRYIFGHSLGGAMAIELASRVEDETGTIVEGTFTSIADVFATMKWGWLPIRPFLTQPFESVDKVARLGAPLLVVHGTQDKMIPLALGRKLYEAAPQPKAFVQVEGGTHHNTNALGQAQYRTALLELFGKGSSAMALALNPPRSP
ncbi:MAG: lysophospholipase [Pseudomonadota bacterium]|nr:lysophospholipase [Pseudomonadota bacterium]